MGRALEWGTADALADLHDEVCDGWADAAEVAARERLGSTVRVDLDN